MQRPQQDDQDARAYLAEVGFKALPGFVRDLKGYEIALLKAKRSPKRVRTRSMTKLLCW